MKLILGITLTLAMTFSGSPGFASNPEILAPVSRAEAQAQVTALQAEFNALQKNLDHHIRVRNTAAIFALTEAALTTLFGAKFYRVVKSHTAGTRPTELTMRRAKVTGGATLLLGFITASGVVQLIVSESNMLTLLSEVNRKLAELEQAQIILELSE